jgi:hypothetical protein
MEDNSKENEQQINVELSEEMAEEFTLIWL